MKSDACLTPDLFLDALGVVIHDPAKCGQCPSPVSAAVPVFDDRDLSEFRQHRPALPVRLMARDARRLRPATPGIAGRLAAILDGDRLLYADPELVRTG